MRARLVPVLVAMTFVASGCAGGGEPEVTPAPLPAAGASPSPTAETAVAAEVPAEASEATPEGAAEFASHYAKAVFDAYKSLDTTQLELMSSSTCATCQRYIQTVNEIRESGARIADSYTVEVLDVVAPTKDPSTPNTTVTIFLRIGAFEVTDSDGRPLVQEAPQEQAVQNITLERAGNSWLTASIAND